MKATTIGIDLAKHLFQLHGVDHRWSPPFAKLTNSSGEQVFDCSHRSGLS